MVKDRTGVWLGRGWLEAYEAGVRQYVVLGAGLDTFAYRNPYAHLGLHVFEVDHPSTQQWKRQCLAKADISPPSTLHFVPVDFERDQLAQALTQAGFQADQPTCFTWMGVTVYLTSESVMDTLAFVAVNGSEFPKKSGVDIAIGC